jgi:DNA-binding NarL/FixJ family response regulator
MNTSKIFKVFIQEDEALMRDKISQELKDKKNYKIHFFSKQDSVFDLLKFGPDIVFHDYFKNKATHFYMWAVPY